MKVKWGLLVIFLGITQTVSAKIFSASGKVSQSFGVHNHTNTAISCIDVKFKWYCAVDSVMFGNGPAQCSGQFEGERILPIDSNQRIGFTEKVKFGSEGWSFYQFVFANKCGGPWIDILNIRYNENTPALEKIRDLSLLEIDEAAFNIQFASGRVYKKREVQFGINVEFRSPENKLLGEIALFSSRRDSMIESLIIPIRDNYPIDKLLVTYKVKVFDILNSKYLALRTFKKVGHQEVLPPEVLDIRINDLTQ